MRCRSEEGKRVNVKKVIRVEHLGNGIARIEQDRYGLVNVGEFI